MPIHGYPGGVISSTAPTIAPTGASGVWTTETQLQNSANWPSADYITRSLRFNSADSAYLSRTPASAGNRKTWTWSGWVKRSKLSGSFYFFCGNSAASNAGFFGINFEGNDRIEITGWITVWRSTSAQYRDPSAWYHIVVALDTTQATADNRVRLYVNGSEVTAFATKNNPTQNDDLGVNTAAAHYISSYDGTNSDFDGYLADVYFIDGQALTPSSFGFTDPNTGEWQPQVYHGAYGTNGFFLRFANNTNTTSTTLGLDSSGNGNNWTPNNFSVTAGVGNDSLVDSPSSYGTDTGAGGEVRGNYCTWNPLHNKSVTLTNGNLDGSTSSGMVVGTIAVSSGKWYWECTPTDTTAQQVFGIIAVQNTSLPTYPGGSSDSYGYYATNGYKYNNSSSSSYGASYGNGDVIGVALDLDAGTLVFYKNGSSQGTAYSSLSGTFAPASGDGATNAWTSNFGQRPFAYTAPAGFKCLVDTNLATPTVGATATTRADDYFNTVLYTGNGNATAQAITGVGFQPDFVWLKARSQTYEHIWNDRVRGAGKILYSSLNNAEATVSNFVSFDSDGFTVNAAGGASSFNENGTTYASWNWKANGAGSSNTAGSITSTVSVNTTSGLSIVAYTGNATAGATVGHGLNVAPKFVILKSRSVATSWYVWSTGLTSAEYEIYLNLTDAEFNGAFSFLYDAAPTATTFSLPTAGYGSNNSGATYIAYCFASVAGYSAFGKYTGNGADDGPFNYLGFRAAWILVKRSSSAGEGWWIYDNKRSPYNIANVILSPNSNGAEISGGTYPIDINSNGFKIRGSNALLNTNGATYIYAAFAEFPFKFARAR